MKVEYVVCPACQHLQVSLAQPMPLFPTSVW
jgi:hypothetical protein